MSSIVRAVSSMALFTALLVAPNAFAQQGNAPELPPAVTTVALPVAMPTEYNGDVRDLPQTFTPPEYYRMLNEFEAPPNLKPQPPARHGPVGPNSFPLAPMPAPSASFAGLGFSDSVNGGQAGGGWPPDTNGDVGPIYYIQSVNTAIGIFDKATGARTAAFTINQLWSMSGTGTVCLDKNDGDPIVLHDARNDRWILTDFAFGFKFNGKAKKPFYQCIAVSQTSDPVSGGWYFYAIHMDTGAPGGPPSNTLADYPKFGLWNDGCLYMGANGFTSAGGAYGGAIFASFNTADLYAGNALTSSIGYLPYSTGKEFSLFPADLLGSSAASMPPVSTPAYFVAESQTGFQFNVRKFTPGPSCGAGGALGAAAFVDQASYSFNSTTSDFVPQKGTTNKLDSLEDGLMQRVQYRKIGNAESLWVVHTVGDGSTTPAQSQWAQINVTGGTINTTPVQQQIFAPDTTKSRWMAGIAVDGQGNAAMGYSLSSSSDYPGIYVAGRLATDPLNDLPQSEVALVTGGASQVNCGSSACSRWGDYSSMTIDPSDDCTFWYTNEYYDTSAHASSGHWQTRIGKFKFPGCVVTAATYSIGGSVSGLTGSVQLQLDGTNPTSTQTQLFAANGGFTFTTALDAGSDWTVSVAAQPVGQTCAVTSGSGTSLSADVTSVAVTCTPITYAVTPSLTGNGSISPNTAQTVNSGTTTTFTLTPTSGNKIGSVGGTCGGTLTGNSYTTNPVTADCTVIANFTPITYTLTYTAGTNGTTSGTSPQTVNSGANGTSVTAVANAGYHFVQWSDASTANPRTDSNVQADVSVTATFAINTYTLTYTAGANGTTSGTSPQTVNSGANGTSVTAVANAGYHFVQWSDASTANPRQDMNVTADVSVEAQFAVNVLTFTPEPDSVIQGGTLGTITVTEQDGSGTTIADGATIDFTLTYCSGATLDLGTAMMSGGVATLASGQRFYNLTQSSQITASIVGTSPIAPVDASFSVITNSAMIFPDGFESCRP